MKTSKKILLMSFFIIAGLMAGNIQCQAKQNNISASQPTRTSPQGLQCHFARYLLISSPIAFFRRRATILVPIAL